MIRDHKINNILTRKKRIPIKSKYTQEVNINITKTIGTQYNKYNKKNFKLFTNDIKIALFIFPTTFIVGNILNESEQISNSLYIISGCSLAYAITNIHNHKKEKQKRFTIK